MGRKAKNILKPIDTAVRKAIKDAKSDKQEKTWLLEDNPKLRLRARPTGIGTWYSYYTVHGKERKLELGEFPALSLKGACKRNLEVRAAVDRGEDPYLAKEAVKQSITFKELAEGFIASDAITQSTADGYAGILAKDAFPLFGHKPAAAVTPDDVYAMCDAIKKRGGVRAAQHAKSAVGGTYRYGIKKRYVKVNPAREVGNQQEKKSVRTRVPTDDEIAAIWRGISSNRRADAVRIIVQLGILTGQRRKELCGARVEEVKNDVWTIPAPDNKRSLRRMKNGEEQRVYLSTQAAALFDEALTTCSDGEWFFPTQGVRGKPNQKPKFPHTDPGSITQAVGKLGVADVSLHDMRRAITSFLGERDDVSGRTLDMVIHHKRSDDRTEDGTTSVTATHYNMARRERQLRAAWQAWADHVEAIVSGDAGD